MRVWSLAKVFHTCGKNCGKSTGSADDAKIVARKHAVPQIHPGGPKILDATAGSLGLSPDRVWASREVLDQYGNMSSATVLFILKRLLERKSPAPCVAIGFGPGLNVEVALFE